jgi:hypothetical protein
MCRYNPRVREEGLAGDPPFAVLLGQREKIGLARATPIRDSSRANTAVPVCSIITIRARTSAAVRACRVGHRIPAARGRAPVSGPHGVYTGLQCRRDRLIGREARALIVCSGLRVILRLLWLSRLRLTDYASLKRVLAIYAQHSALADIGNGWPNHDG